MATQAATLRATQRLLSHGPAFPPRIPLAGRHDGVVAGRIPRKPRPHRGHSGVCLAPRPALPTSAAACWSPTAHVLCLRRSPAGRAPRPARAPGAAARRPATAMRRRSTSRHWTTSCGRQGASSTRWAGRGCRAAARARRGSRVRTARPRCWPAATGLCWRCCSWTSPARRGESCGTRSRPRGTTSTWPGTCCATPWGCRRSRTR